MLCEYSLSDVVNLESDLSLTSSQPSLEDDQDLLNLSFETLKRYVAERNHDKLIYGND